MGYHRKLKTARVKSFHPLSAFTLTKEERSHSLNLMAEFIQTLPEHLRASASPALTKKLVSARSANTRERALATFKDTETTCYQVNRRFRSGSGLQELHRNLPMVHTASRIIAKILGKLDINRILHHGCFGPGATSTISGFDVSLVRKFADLSVTSELKQHAQQWLASFPLWSASLIGCDVCNVSPLLHTVKGSKFSSVPKDDTTDRLIASEPTINSFFQQAAGRFIRTRLLSIAHVNLNDQTLNQRLAQLGSIDNSIATIDLKNASNLISIEVVRLLLPPDWFHLLSLLRSHSMNVNGENIKLESFSSMGNGFTFDLQSLIFYAISKAVCTLTRVNTFWVNVFGDDIVVPSCAYSDVAAALEFFGFTVNHLKSFSEGPFRESCGHDYFNGLNIRPVYVKNLATYVDLIALIHRWQEYERRVSISTKLLRLSLTELIPERFRFLGPLNAVGGFVPTSFDVATPSLASYGWQGFHYKFLKPVLASREDKSRHYMTASISASLIGRNIISLRKDPIGYVVCKGYAFTWD